MNYDNQKMTLDFYNDPEVVSAFVEQTSTKLSLLDFAKEFDENSFDAAWINASLIHIPEDEILQVLSGLRKILTPGSPIYIGLKSGKQGSEIVTDTKYKKTIQREFMFWQEENFLKVSNQYGLKLVKSWQDINGVTGTEPTHWLNLLFTLEK